MKLAVGLILGFLSIALFFVTFFFSFMMNSFAVSLPFWGCLGFLIIHCWSDKCKRKKLRNVIVFGVLLCIWLALVLLRPQLNNYS